MGSASAANADTVSVLPVLLSASGSHCPVMEALTRCKGLALTVHHMEIDSGT
ncbi:hypothetical protein ACRRTK_021968 [Alexandromys fortis]